MTEENKEKLGDEQGVENTTESQQTSNETAEVENQAQEENTQESEPGIQEESDNSPQAEAESEEVAIAEETEVVEEVAETVAEEPEDILPTPGDFDWDADEKGFDDYSATERDRLERIYGETVNTVETNTIVDAVVASIGSKDVVLNIGFKSDGLVPLTEFRDKKDLKVGDEVRVLVIEQEDKNGQLLLSRRHAKLLGAWEAINKAFAEDLVIEGKVKSRTRGGLVVDIDGVETFLPGSQIDVKPVRDYDQYVGKSMEFKVVKINQLLKNAVVSHKVLIQKDLEAQKDEIISRLEKGQVLEGVIKNMTDFGVFIDLGGVDGLLHITDISWGRINHPSDVLELDQSINVVVLDYDEGKKRISLGLKQLDKHPWEEAAEDLEVGKRVKGKIVTVTDYGSFMEIAPGVEGLIHVSEMSWSQHLRNPQDFHTVGDEVEAVILSIDKEEHKMSLGIKQLTPDPWIDIETKYPLESKHTGIVRNLTNYGLFVELGEGVDGLVHVSDLSWTKKVKHPSEFIKTGEKIDVVVLEIDKENRRLSLGHKQLKDDPWETYETIFLEGSVHQGTINYLEDNKGAVVSLPYDVEGFAPKKHLSKEDGSVLKPGDEAEFKIIEFNRDLHRIVVSHSRIWQEEKGIEAPKSSPSPKKAKRGKAKAQDTRATMGELGAMGALTQLKTDLEKQEKIAQKEAIDKMEDQQAATADAKAEEE